MDTLMAPKPGLSVSWASLMLLRVLPERAKLSAAHVSNPFVGYIFVINGREYGNNAKYKIAGGSRKGEDLEPITTAIRETLEETGIAVAPERVTYLDRQFGGRGVSHWKYLFQVDIFESDRNRMNSRQPGNEGEIPTFFTESRLQEEIYRGRFLETHLAWLRKLGIVPKDNLAA
jgi:predicted NUDIX family NTP pyrophosphohydrolase